MAQWAYILVLKKIESSIFLHGRLSRNSWLYNVSELSVCLVYSFTVEKYKHMFGSKITRKNHALSGQNGLPAGLHRGNEKLWAIGIGSWICHRDHACNHGVNLTRHNSNKYLINDNKTSRFKKENNTNRMKCLKTRELLHTSMRMFNPEILVREGATINRFGCFAIMMNNISTLNHETRYYPMKWCSFVIKFYTTWTFAFLPYTIYGTLLISARTKWG